MGRRNDGRILVNNEEWCLGYSTQTRKQECGIFQVDLQDKMFLKEVSKNTRQDLWLEDSLRKSGLIMKRYFL